MFLNFLSKVECHIFIEGLLSRRVCMKYLMESKSGIGGCSADRLMILIEPKSGTSFPDLLIILMDSRPGLSISDLLMILLTHEVNLKKLPTYVFLNTKATFIKLLEKVTRFTGF